MWVLNHLTLIKSYDLLIFLHLQDKFLLEVQNYLIKLCMILSIFCKSWKLEYQDIAMAVAWCMLNPDLEKLDAVSLASTDIVSIFSVPTTTNSQ